MSEDERGFTIPPGLRSDILRTALEARLMPAGELPAARKPVPRLTRLRWKIQAARTRLAEIAYRVIDGGWPPDPEDYL